jgi:hypothetical protein
VVVEDQLEILSDGAPEKAGGFLICFVPLINFLVDGEGIGGVGVGYWWGGFGPGTRVDGSDVDQLGSTFDCKGPLGMVFGPREDEELSELRVLSGPLCTQTPPEGIVLSKNVDISQVGCHSNPTQ